MIYLIGSMSNFIVGNNEVARFEQNNKGMVAKFVSEHDDVFNHKGTIPVKSIRNTKVRDRMPKLIYSEFTMNMENIITYMFSQKAGQ